MDFTPLPNPIMIAGPYPADWKFLFANITERNNLSISLRYKGLVCAVQGNINEEVSYWHLPTTDLSNAGWQSFSSGGSESGLIRAYQVGNNYKEDEAFYDNVTGYIYSVLGDYTSVDIDTDLLNGDIRRIGGSGTGGTAQEVEMGEVINVNISAGGITVGQTINSTDTVFDVFNKVFNPLIPPTYLSPTLAISTSPLAFEIGENIIPSITSNFQQRDGGSALQYRLYQGATTTTPIFTNSIPTTYSVPSFQLLANTGFTGQVDYDDGPIKPDSHGNPDPTGRILAGTVTSSALNILAQRKCFFGELLSPTPPTDSTEARALTSSTLNPANNTSMAVTLNNSHGAAWVYPATLRVATSCTSIAIGNVPINTLQYTEFLVEGANGVSPILYRCYYFISATAMSDTYTLVI